MYAEKQYLTEVLKRSGIRARVHESLKSMESSGEIQIGGVIRYDDVLQRSGSKKIYEDQSGARHKRTKIWDREIKLKVIIGEATEEKCESIFDCFLRNLDRGIWIDGNWEGISVEGVDWVEGKDSILKSRIAVEAVIVFEGGIYRDTDYAAADKVSVIVEKGEA